MKNIPVKLVSCALAASMLLSVAACNKKNNSSSRDKSHSGQKISADTPWYDSKLVTLDVDFDNSKEVDYTYPRLAGVDKDNIVVLTTGYYKMPEDIDWENYDYNAYAIALISVIDRATSETVLNIDLTSNLSSDDYMETAMYNDGVVTAVCSSYDMNTYNMTRKEMDFDVKTGKLIDTRELAEDESGIERSFKFGDYKIDTSMNYEDRASYNLYVYSPNGDKETVELKDNGKDYYDIPVILQTAEKTVLIPVSTDDGFIFFEMDLETLKMTPKDSKDYDWINFSEVYSPFVNDNGDVYYSSSTGITKIDFKAKKTEEIFNYSWCGISRNKLNYLEIADMTDDAFVLCGENYSGRAYSNESSSEFVLIEFSKAAKNPHAGKTILELYSSGRYLNDQVSEAIMKFNETNSDYFIEVTDRYSDVTANYTFSEVNSDDDMEEVQLGMASEMSNQLAMDILNGEGPDILMDVSSYGQLNSTNYLADLSPYVSNLTSDKYFTNVIDGSKVDGKLFNLPVCFTINGIQTDSKYAGKSGVGFTTEEYEKFLNDTLNGKDIITSGQAFYFAKLFTNMSDKFIVNGKADFSSQDFADLAKFVKDNVRETSRSWDDYSEESVYGGFAVGAAVKGDSLYDNSVATYTYCYGISSYLITLGQLQGASAILGIPSADGRGPSVEPYVSVAVSSQAYNVDACGEFVKMLLSDDVQMNLAKNDNLVLNRNAFKEGAKLAIEYYNGEGGDGYFGYDWNTGEELKNRIKFSNKNIDDMEKIILSCSIMHSADAAINLILIEEMPAYFSGQKELDDVVRIAQDRAQKVLDERG